MVAVLSDGGYDRLAAIYPWLECAMFGGRLRRARQDACQFWSEHCSTPAHPTSITLLGDGRGQCLPLLHNRFVDASIVSVDRSAAMLQHQRRRLSMDCTSHQSLTDVAASKVRFIRADALTVSELDIAPEIVLMPFFTDHLAERAVQGLTDQLQSIMIPPRLIWHLDFEPPRRLRDRVRGQLMTTFFNWTTDRPKMGMRDEHAILQRSGWRRIANQRLHPMISASIWTFDER